MGDRSAHYPILMRYTPAPSPPANWKELRDETQRWVQATREWMAWVRDDLVALEARTGVALAPPPPPPDPW